MKNYSRVCAEINLDHFEHNLNEIHRLVNPNSKIIAVIKTDGYGHGAVELAGILENHEEIWGYAVATVDEARILMDQGVKKNLLILGYVFEEDYPYLVEKSIRTAVFTLEMARSLSAEAVKQNKELPIHIKLDTGMSRIGFQITKEDAAVIEEISKLPNLQIEGIFTHFAKADEVDKAFTHSQADGFFSMIKWLEEKGVEIPLHHVSNSAGIIDLPEYNLDLVRAGIILYGLWPSDEVMKDKIDLKPLLTLKSHIVHIKELEDGRSVSYGGTYVVSGKRRIATIPVGYGDGYSRGLSNCGYVLIHGKRAPICGRVCMDQFMVDVTDISNLHVGDEVILIGESQNEHITMEEIGDLSQRFNYEFACDIGKRVPRVYVRDGKRISASKWTVI